MPVTPFSFPGLRPRLRTLAQRVPAGSRTADVGADHAYLSISLLQSGAAVSAVATDISMPCTVRAADNAAHSGLGRSEHLYVRCGNGLSTVSPDEADVILIAGMGGLTIASILEADPWAMDGRLLLLQPASHHAELRAFLSRSGCRIEDEWAVRDSGRIYLSMEVRGGYPREDPDPAVCLASDALLKKRDPDASEWLDRLEARLEKILAEQRKAGAAEADITAGQIASLRRRRGGFR